MAVTAMEVILRSVRAVGYGGTAGLLLLVVGGAIAAGLDEPDGREGLPPRPGEGGFAIGLGHFEATMNWLTVLGGAMLGFATPAWRVGRMLRLFGASLAGVGASILAFMVYFALDDAMYWSGDGDANLRPWWTIGIALLAGLAAAAGYWLKGEPHQASEATS